MGLDIRTAEFLLYCRARGVDFGESLTLGRQSVRLSGAEIAQLRTRTGVNLAEAAYGEPFFTYLGARRVDSLDASAYEEATIIFNLNGPAPEALLAKFSCVIDGGTLEHIFHIPTALASCMRMVRTGGHFISCAPANNLMGHGFYQFSPEFFWNALSPRQGFQVEAMFLHEAGDWYSVADPSVVGERVQAVTAGETFLFVCARKVAEVPLFVIAPHQSDYAGNLAPSPGTAGRPLERGWKERLVRAIPLLAQAQAHWRKAKYRRQCRLTNGRLFQKLGKHLPSR